MKRRKSRDPVATRYRIATTALAKAERRKAAAEKSITELRKKVRYYERSIPADKRAGIAAEDAARKQDDTMRRERWKEAEKVLRTAATMAGMKRPELVVLMTKGKRQRRFALAVELAEGQCLVWDFRDGFKTGRWSERLDRKALKPVRDTDHNPAVQYVVAAHQPYAEATDAAH